MNDKLNKVNLKKKTLSCCCYEGKELLTNIRCGKYHVMYSDEQKTR